MKKRILYIITLFFTLLLLFVSQKPLFMLYNDAVGKDAVWSDFFQVMLHGASLDATTAGYLTALPLLFIIISIWLKKVSLRKYLIPYYIIASLLVSITFVVDMGLYPFWGFKLDASVFLYLDSPEEAMEVATEFGRPVVLKSQVLVGGRGKAGGIKFADNPGEAFEIANDLLKLEIKGEKVKHLLIEEKANIQREFFLSVSNDRANRTPIIMASAEGGVEIEELAKTTNPFTCPHGRPTLIFYST